MHCICPSVHPLSQPQSFCGHDGSGGQAGGAELEHLGRIDGTSAGQKETIRTPTNQAVIAATNVKPATRSLNKILIKAINNVSAIKYNRLFDFLLLPIFVYTCAV
jgi:hypothetical protein